MPFFFMYTYNKKTIKLVADFYCSDIHQKKIDGVPPYFRTCADLVSQVRGFDAFFMYTYSKKTIKLN